MLIQLQARGSKPGVRVKSDQIVDQWVLLLDLTLTPRMIVPTSVVVIPAQAGIQDWDVDSNGTRIPVAKSCFQPDAKLSKLPGLLNSRNDHAGYQSHNK